ncbi:MAG: hypothetical protein AAGC68_04165 [Verrucomicrobiota bacterium]
MNTGTYLILIAALFIVASLMLYARFISRSQEIFDSEDEKSGLGFGVGDQRLHGSETLEADETISVLESGEGGAAVAAFVDDRDLQEEKGYLDELQEAAAGLAMLMRSSPVKERSSPVVFAPSTEEAEESHGENSFGDAAVADGEGRREAVTDEDIEVSDEVGSAIPDRELTDVDKAPAEEGEASFEGGAIERGGGREADTLSGLLGEEVIEMMASLDHALDELEDLVSGMEETLVSLDFAETDAEGEVIGAAA